MATATALDDTDSFVAAVRDRLVELLDQIARAALQQLFAARPGGQNQHESLRPMQDAGLKRSCACLGADCQPELLLAALGHIRPAPRSSSQAEQAARASPACFG